jgi:hypothetical protein
MTEILNRFLEFNATLKFQQATVQYMVHNMISKDETAKILKVFKALDTD